MKAFEVVLTYCPVLICKCVNQSYKVDLICISDTESISQKTYVPELNLKCLAWIYQSIRMDRQSILSKDLTKKGFFYGEGVFLVSCRIVASNSLVVDTI